VVFHWAAKLLDVWLALTRPVRAWLAGPFRFRDLWRSLPGDLLGRAVTRACGIPAPSREHDAGDVKAVLVEDPRIALWFRAHLMPVQAQTLGRYVLSRDPLPPDTLAHEIEHIRQWERFGPFYLPLYFGWSAVAVLRGKRAYWDNGFEVAARNRAERDGVAAWESATGTGEDETRLRT
jgi:hypothetical protein